MTVVVTPQEPKCPALSQEWTRLCKGLRTEDGTSSLDLATVFAQTYERGRHDRVLRYANTAALPLAEADREWAARRLNAT